MYKASESMAPCTLEETLQRLNVSEGTTFRASLFRSKASGKLLFLEAGKDFVDVLLSGFLLLPVGTIIHMLTTGMKVKPVAIGISSIFESVQNLTASDLQVAKVHLTRPRPAAIACSCRGYWGPRDCHRCGSIGCHSVVVTSKNTGNKGWGIKEVDLSTIGFVKANTTFIVTDNLEIMPLTTNKSVNVLSKLNVDSLADLEGNDITVSLTQILQLLHSALTSNTCLNEVFEKSMACKFVAFSRKIDQAENSKRYFSLSIGNFGCDSV